MILGKTGESIFEPFSVLGPDDVFVTGIPLSEFTYDLYDPNGSATALPMTFQEMGEGHYRAGFTPDAPGLWYLVVYHSIHFPAGKAGTVQVYDFDMDEIREAVQTVQDVEYGRWRLDGDYMVFFKEDNTTEIARFRIYKDANDNPIERERI